MRPQQQLASVARLQRGVLSRAQVLSTGLTDDALRHRIRPGGPWQRLLPGIYMTASGEPTRDQLLFAALLYAGPGSIITGPAALQLYGIRASRETVVDVLVPHRRQRASHDYVAVHRTSRMPPSYAIEAGLRFALPARAVADTVRGMTALPEVRAVVAGAVQQRRCKLEELATELNEGSRHGSARLREVLAEVVDGIRSVPEGEFRDLIRKSGLPVPLFNPRLFLNGTFLATPDAWWPDAGVIAEIDSREWHLSPADFENTMRRHARLSGAGIVVLHITPRQVRTEPDRVLRDIAGALRAGRRVPGITTRLAAA